MLAVSRSDSTIEIWKTRHSPVFQFTIFPPADVEVSVEGLAWAGDRLFFCELKEWLYAAILLVLNDVTLTKPNALW